MKCGIHHADKLLWFIILHLGINVHRCFAVFVSRKILNRFRINTSVQEISYIGMPKLMRSHVKINGIHQVRVIFLVPSGCWRYGAFDALAIYILVWYKKS